MSVIIIPRKHLSQPQGRLEIAPAWEGLVIFAVAGDARYDVTTGLLGTRSAVEQAVMQDGIAVRATAQNAGVSFDRRPITTAPYSIIAIASPTTEARRQHIFFQGEESDPRYCQISLSAGMDWTGGNLGGAVALVEHDQDYKARAHAINAADGNRHVFVGTRSAPGVVALYRDGVALSLAAASAVAGTAVGIGGAWVGGAGANNRGHAGPIAFCAALNFDLSGAQAREISYAPWQLFRADPIRIYSLPSGPISLTINSITASNIPSSGARITLGLTT